MIPINGRLTPYSDESFEEVKTRAHRGHRKASAIAARRQRLRWERAFSLQAMVLEHEVIPAVTLSIAIFHKFVWILVYFTVVSRYVGLHTETRVTEKDAGF